MGFRFQGTNNFTLWWGLNYICRVPIFNLWHHKITLISMRSTCCVPSFNFFLGAVSEIQRSKAFPFFQHGCHTMWPAMSELAWKHSTRVVAPMVKISSQPDKRLQRKTLKFCVNRQTQMQYLFLRWCNWRTPQSKRSWVWAEISTSGYHGSLKGGV